MVSHPIMAPSTQYSLSSPEGTPTHLKLQLPHSAFPCLHYMTFTLYDPAPSVLHPRYSLALSYFSIVLIPFLFHICTYKEDSVRYFCKFV